MNERATLARWRDELRDSDLDVRVKCVGFVIATYWDRNGGGAFPAKQTIATGATIGKRTADKAIAELERAGFLEVERSKGRRSNTYRATVPTVQPGDTVNGAAAVHGSFLSTVQNGTPNRAESSLQPCSSSAPESAESAESVSTPRATRATGRRPRAKSAHRPEELATLAYLDE